MKKRLNDLHSKLKRQLIRHLNENFYPGDHYRGLWIRDAMFMVRTLIRIHEYKIAKRILHEVSKYQLGENLVNKKIFHRQGIHPGALRRAAKKVNLKFLSRNKGAMPTSIRRNGNIDICGENPDIDSTALWVINMCDFIVNSKDRDFSKDHYSKICQGLEYLKKRAKENAFLIEQGINEDWADCLLRRGKVTYSNALWYEAVNSFQKLEIFLNNNIKQLKILKEKIRNQINKKFWLEKEKYYADYITNGKISKHISQDTALLINFDIVSKERAKIMLRKFEENLWTEYGSLTFWPSYKKTLPVRDYQNSKIWPWISGFEIIAQVKVGNRKKAVILLNKILPNIESEWISKNGNPYGARPFFTGIASILEAISELKEN